MTISFRALAVFTGALALAGCSANPVDVEDAPVVSFTYSGPVSGSYHTRGTLQQQSDFLKQNGATGALESGELEVQALLQRGASSVDILTFSVPRTTAGVETITESCPPGSGCARLLLGLGQPHADGGQALQSCSLTQGSIRVTAISDGRATGEFSGTGSCISDRGEVTDGFAVSAGSFNVPLR